MVQLLSPQVQSPTQTRTHARVLTFSVKPVKAVCIVCYVYGTCTECAGLTYVGGHIVCFPLPFALWCLETEPEAHWLASGPGLPPPPLKGGCV